MTHRIETTNTIWEFDVYRMVYVRIPKNESMIHPEPLGKPYEGHEVPFTKIVLGAFTPDDKMQQFFVYNNDGTITSTWAVPGQDWEWLQKEFA